MADRLVKIRIRQVGDERVMYEQIQPFSRTADRPNVTLQFPLDAPHPASAELSAILRLEPDSDAPRRALVSNEHLPNEVWLESERATYLPWILFHMLAKASLGPCWSQEFALKTAESHWPGRQREP